jgi:3-methyl-2-oxobutanoate hydroxymethyltransferase
VEHVQGGIKRRRKVTLPLLQEMKRRHLPIVMVTAYDAPGGRLIDQAGVEIILVGDTAAEMVHGHSSTTPATMDEQVLMTRAVSDQVSRALVVGDLPFGSYEGSDKDAAQNAIRLVKEGDADVVKLEGSRPQRVRAITSAGIGVMGHLGLTPQSQTALGGRKVQGRTAAAAQRLLNEAHELAEAGCFALVFEAVPGPVAEHISQQIAIPTIGIGAGRGCDGQVLVYHDLLGLLDWSPRFAKQYTNGKGQIGDALARYAADVRSNSFGSGDRH